MRMNGLWHLAFEITFLRVDDVEARRVGATSQLVSLRGAAPAALERGEPAAEGLPLARRQDGLLPPQVGGHRVQVGHVDDWHGGERFEPAPLALARCEVDGRAHGVRAVRAWQRGALEEGPLAHVRRRGGLELGRVEHVVERAVADRQHPRVRARDDARLRERRPVLVVAAPDRRQHELPAHAARRAVSDAQNRLSPLVCVRREAVSSTRCSVLPAAGWSAPWRAPVQRVRERERRADGAQLVEHEGDVALGRHAARRPEKLGWHRRRVRQHAHVVVLRRVAPHARLAQPVALARCCREASTRTRHETALSGRVPSLTRRAPHAGVSCKRVWCGKVFVARRTASVLEGGVDRVGIPATPLRQARDKIVVAAAEERERQHSAHHAPLKAPEEPRVRRATTAHRAARTRERVELALVPSPLGVACHLHRRAESAYLGTRAEHARGWEERCKNWSGVTGVTVRPEHLAHRRAPRGDEGQRRLAKEHVADVERRGGGRSILEPAIIRAARVGEVVRRGQERCLAILVHEGERLSQHQCVDIGDHQLEAPADRLVDELRARGPTSGVGVTTRRAQARREGRRARGAPRSCAGRAP
eukprot:3852824-Prymnesium_polylepis.1